MNPVELVVSKLAGAKQHGKQWKARCPAHEDRVQSLSVTEGKKGAILKCHAGCTVPSIVGALGLKESDLFFDQPLRPAKLGPIVSVYSYEDENGVELYQATRHEPKDFRQRHPVPGSQKKFPFLRNNRTVWEADGYEYGIGNVRRVLFHLPFLHRARADGAGTVWVAEGEKDVLALESAGAVATCNAMGADAWRDEYSEQLRDLDVVLVRDKDKAGYKHVRAVARSLQGIAASVRCVEAKEGKDAADHLGAGFGLDDFVEVDIAEVHPEESSNVSQGILEAIAESDLPTIETNDRQLRDMTTEAFDAVVRANDPRKTFVRGGEMVRVVEDEHGRATIQQILGDLRVGLLARVANWVSTSSKRGTISVRPPEVVARDLSMLTPWEGLPPLIALSPCPVVAPDGTIMRKKGYHEGSKTYVSDGDDWPVFRGSGAEAARWIFAEVLVDFPFADQASRANALALMITSFVRPLITSTVPFFLFDAPTPGTGKTWCAQACLYPGLGLIDAKSPPVKEEEWTKLITTVLSSGVPALIVDNIVGKMESASFMAVITSTSWSDRLFGKNTTLMSLPNRCLYVGTANNATMADDLVSRTVPIRLDSGKERPEERTGFRHPNLMEWLAQNRARMGAACVAMVQAWVDAGMPKSEKNHARFASWAETVGGVLHVCDVSDFLGNLESLRDANDDEHILWSQFLSDWRTTFQGQETTVQELVSRLGESDALKTILGGDPKDTEEKKRRRLGLLINHRIDKVFGDTSIRRGSRSKLGRRFKIALQGDSSETNSLFGGQREEVFGKPDTDTPYEENRKSGSSVTTVTAQVQKDPYEDPWHELVSPPEEGEEY